MSLPRRVLIAGAGDVGTGAARILQDRGVEVVALRRRAELVPEALAAMPADLTSAASLSRALRAEMAQPPAGQGFDTVVYAASPDARDEAAYRRVYVRGLANLLHALADSPAGPPRRLLVLSTTGVYGQRHGEWVDEDSPTEPAAFTGQVVLEAETLARRAIADARILRLGGIYGPGRTRLVEQVRRGEASCASGPVRFTNRIHRDDAAAAVAHLSAAAEVPPVVNVVDDDPASRAEVLRWLAERLHAPPPRVVVPDPGEAPPNKRVSNRRLRASGFELGYPSYRDGYAAVLAQPR